MNGARGNRPELFEPGARIKYISARRDSQRPDGSACVKIESSVGVVESQTERYVTLESGDRVPKSDVLGPNTLQEGERLYDVVLHHQDGSRIHVQSYGRTADEARERIETKANRLFNPGAWTAGGATWLREERT